MFGLETVPGNTALTGTVRAQAVGMDLKKEREYKKTG